MNKLFLFLSILMAITAVIGQDVELDDTEDETATAPSSSEIDKQNLLQLLMPPNNSNNNNGMMGSNNNNKPENPTKPMSHEYDQYYNKKPTTNKPLALPTNKPIVVNVKIPVSKTDHKKFEGQFVPSKEAKPVKLVVRMPTKPMRTTPSYNYEVVQQNYGQYH